MIECLFSQSEHAGLQNLVPILQNFFCLFVWKCGMKCFNVFFWPNEVHWKTNFLLLVFKVDLLPSSLKILVEHSTKNFLIQWRKPGVCNIFLVCVTYSERIWNHVFNEDQWLYLQVYSRGLCWWQITQNTDWSFLGSFVHNPLVMSLCIRLHQCHQDNPVNVPDQSEAHYETLLLSQFLVQHLFVKKDMKWLASHDTCVARAIQR